MKDQIQNELVVPFTMVPNEILSDPNLSLKQKGMLCYLISLPKGWTIYKSELENHFTDGRESISNALEDLVKMEFVSKVENQKQKGKFSGFTYTVLPLRVNRDGLSAAVNPQLINTNSNNTNRVNLNINAEFENSAETDKNSSSVKTKTKKKGEKRKSDSAHHRIIQHFFEVKHPDFVFGPVHARSVQLLIANIHKLFEKKSRTIDDQSVGDFAITMLDNLPSFYVGKDLAVINSKFNEIILELTNTIHGKPKPATAAEATRQQVREAFPSRNSPKPN